MGRYNCGFRVFFLLCQLIGVPLHFFKISRQGNRLYLLFQQSSVPFWIIDRPYFLLVSILTIYNIFVLPVLEVFMFVFQFDWCFGVVILAGTTNLILILWCKFSWCSSGLKYLVPLLMYDSFMKWSTFSSILLSETWLTEVFAFGVPNLWF